MALTHSQIGKKGPLCTLELVVKKEQIKLTKNKAEKTKACTFYKTFFGTIKTII